MFTRTLGELLVVASLLAGLMWLVGGDDYARPRPFAGDHLGQHAQQPDAEYQSLADDSLATALADAPGHNAFAMISFTEPLTSAEAGELAADLHRVGTVITQDLQILALPEPTDASTYIAAGSRAEVFANVLANTVSAASDATTPGIIAVVAYDTPRHLAPLANSPHVYAVEVLPPDAVFGQFGISPPQVTFHPPASVG